jgi:hypothetical protein
MWAILLVALWLLLGGANLLLSAATKHPVQLCLFKRVTGFPCPTCGFTRGMLALLQGHPVQAWLYNPLLFSLLGITGGVLLVSLLTGKTLRITLTRRERLAGWAVLAVLFVANWFYVIRYVG